MTLFIANSCAMAGTPIMIPFDKNTAKNDVINDISTTYVSNSIFIITLSLIIFYKFHAVIGYFSYSFLKLLVFITYSYFLFPFL